VGYSRPVSNPAGHVVLAVVTGLVGLMIGSFINVVAYRLPRGMSVVRPRSRCPTCQTQLAGVDNVPVVSWLALRGRCRFCAAQIPARYPVVELVTGALFASTAAALVDESPLVPVLLVAAAVVAATAVDLDGLTVPAPVWVAGLTGVGGLWLVAAAGDELARIAWSAGTGSATVVLWAAGELVVRRAGLMTTDAGAPSLGLVRRQPDGSTVGRALAVAGTAAAGGWLWPFGGWLVVVSTAAAAAVASARGTTRRAMPAVMLVAAVLLVVSAAVGGA
jgi:leader peptidase (prepilin peptidase)/N-methyltransferase